MAVKDKSKVTLADVAAAAGVSKMTASRSFSQPKLVSVRTRERVLRAGEDLGYVPDLLAAAFSSQRTKALGVIVPTHDVATYADTVRGVSDIASARGYDLFMGQTKFDDAVERRVIRAFAGRKVDGILIIGSTAQQNIEKFFAERSLPLVQLWDAPNKPIDMASGFSNTRAGRLVATHFAEKGYPSCMVASSSFYRDRQRAKSFISTAQKLGIHEVSEFVFPDKKKDSKNWAEFEGGTEIAAHILNMQRRPRAVFITDDTAAFSALFALMRAGVKVPEEIAVCGFGNEEFTKYMLPRLTTIDIDGYKIGEVGASLIIDRIEGQPIGTKTHRSSVLLVEGETT